jgi:hypothetical protein
MRVRVYAEGPGRLAVTPVGKSKLKSSAQTLEGEELTTVVLKPTRAGLRELRRSGELQVRARFTFTPCGGAATTAVRTYTLKMR